MYRLYKEYIFYKLLYGPNIEYYKYKDIIYYFHIRRLI